MTQQGKCESRKVKCDEKKPHCSACKKAFRPCAYKYADSVKYRDPFIATKSEQDEQKAQSKPEQRETICLCIDSLQDPWQLRTSRKAPSGQGTFTTLAPGKKYRREQPSKTSSPPKLYRCPNDESQALAARWSSTFGSSTTSICSFSIVGPWRIGVPTLLGHSKALDCALVYAMDSLDLYLRRANRLEIQNDVPPSAAEALESLRDALDSDDRLANDSNVVAVSLLLAAECFREVTAPTCTVHIFAIMQMVELRIKSGHFGQVDRDLLRSISLSAMIESVLAGRVCSLGEILADETRRETEAISKEDQLLVALDQVTARMLLIPKAVQLLRGYSCNPDFELCKEITNMFTQIVHMPNIEAVQALLESCRYIITDPPSLPAAPRYPLAYAFGFETVTGLQLAVHFYTYKALLSELLLRCVELGIALPAASPSFYPNPAAIQRESASYAECLIRCCPYTLSLDTSVPTGAIRMLKSMLTSWTSWDRQLDDSQYRSNANGYCYQNHGTDSGPSSLRSSRQSTISRGHSPDLLSPFTIDPKNDQELLIDDIEAYQDCGANDTLGWSHLVARTKRSELLPKYLRTPTSTFSQRPTQCHALKMRTYCEELSNHALNLWSRSALDSDKFARIRSIFMGAEEPGFWQRTGAANVLQARYGSEDTRQYGQVSTSYFDGDHGLDLTDSSPSSAMDLAS